MRDAQTTEIEPTGPPVTRAYCSRCSTSYVYGDRHTCSLTAREQVRVTRAKAELAAAEARRKRSVECPDCGHNSAPGPSSTHVCRLKRDKTLPNPLKTAADLLRSAGYDISPR